MLVQARYDELRDKMEVVKGLYTSRHYTQCTKVGQRLLAETKGDIHPIHLAYLNFYIALSHDTLAREATLKNRHKELSLAERHYLAAMAALTPSMDQNPRVITPPSPASSVSDESPVWRLRRSSNAASIDSQADAAHTSYFNPQDSPTTAHRKLGTFAFDQAPHRTLFTVTASRPQTPEEYQIAADTTAFLRMIRSHLVGVQELKSKTAVPSVRFTVTPQESPTKTKPRASVLVEDEDAVRRAVLERRRAMKWRPRFDPSSTQQLCHEALAELC